MISRLRRWRQSHIVRVTLPWTAAILVGTFGLSYVTQLRYDVHDRQRSTERYQGAASAANVDMQRSGQKNQRAKFDLVQEHARMQRELEGKDWDMVRVPRPEERD